MHHCHQCQAKIDTVDRILVTITEIGSTNNIKTVVVCNKKCLTDMFILMAEELIK